MENNEPNVQVNKINLEYNQKVEEFLTRNRDGKSFSIMHKAYLGKRPSDQEVTDYLDKLYGTKMNEDLQRLQNEQDEEEEQYDDEEEEYEDEEEEE